MGSTNAKVSQFFNKAGITQGFPALYKIGAKINDWRAETALPPPAYNFEFISL
jgi:hypothetical protein